MTQLCARKLTIVGADNGLSPGRHQTIIWTNGGILLICTLGNLKRNSYTYIQENEFDNVVSEMVAILSRPQYVKVNMTQEFCICVLPRVMLSGLIYPRFNEVEKGLYWFHLVHLSVCPSVDRIVSALYPQQYSSDPFHICTSYQLTSEGVSLVMVEILANSLNL